MNTQQLNLETNVNDIKVNLYLGFDGDYHVTAEYMDHIEPEFLAEFGEFTHVIFDEFEDAKKFYDALIESAK
jgi:hypothetical protein